MSTAPLRLGTRGSPLALWQANYIADKLRPVAAPRAVELVLIETHGDRDQASALSAMGGFGVFTKAIQSALLDGRADVAVHSLKDLPTIPEPQLELVAVPARGPTGDAFVSRKHKRFDDLPRGATVGTSSLRRRAQVLNRRPDLNLLDLRGNVDTRLRKLDEQNLDAIILAEAGLVRLGLADRITEILDAGWMLPAVGQGAIGLECRTDDAETKSLVTQLRCPDTLARVQAERAMLYALGGGCLVPIGTTSKVLDGVLTVRGAVLSTDGKRRIVATHSGLASAPLALGQELAAMLLAEGANEVL
ncbi:porphobilinogen deaminase : Porphobilinogen deaminase OS=Pirellula staleyi (strain ATCC 27377 / DSM 6068 / ICPB 4128) GN=hemC PE=3 SV=1: Porphobil_deam: Porphobil_deamC [Gemmata massiliana]|uniref:Porphobilinogen deaminase n=1 Tax=Gemmata massiliana TaxID=1210884 RepID=A0A6P2D6L3_9BACT|nr:hydroxymethylbilane synthase [Gemmata massiliana]VTR96106.1 porphobilinogen deaminase : Porphobilinogen deaminase OS=Pirellula staleyi (strain ATCC 27377 / DSM 6068 / ICPB 4128) GN=hemC PE=3 SV=1: Porphobil_deam: Porphobil_deamC [Gemmata massiliana]